LNAARTAFSFPDGKATVADSPRRLREFSAGSGNRSATSLLLSEYRGEQSIEFLILKLTERLRQVIRKNIWTGGSGCLGGSGVFGR
jgi:hypothetical protein